MLKNKVTAILIAGMILLTGTTVMAQSVRERTSESQTELSLDREWLQGPTLYCMNIDRGSPRITRKRLALDPSIQELRWVAAHGPRREMLEEFLSRQAGHDEVGEDGQMARVGGTVESWSEIVTGNRRFDGSLGSIGSLNVSLVGPESFRR